VGDVLRLSAEALYKALDDVIGVFWLRVDVLVDPTEELVVAELEAWVETLYDNASGIISTNVLGNRVVVLNARKDEFVGEASWDFAGTAAPPDLPAQSCALLVGRTSRPRAQARKYLGVLTEGVQDDSQLTAAAFTAAENMANAWNDQHVAPSGNTYTPGVLNQTATAPPPPDDFNELTSMKAIRFIRTQRRRTLSRGS
jgi:hypothetical protein